ncbi:hypothetical protein FXF51_56900 [Nonomuraea sp. PA05]|uniref:hypothetical protein n=1 Tax=Nonomuraea sp. PA05 TaxID=2604466 RepID=UPI0011DC17A8|nr:hypothetical protein [Nonomuraea sp. PA05]TYB50260.1 hypothetical protein FXF51_56900 [Nonomuraea sp. PA05]
MTGQHTAGASITVTLRDGSQVTTSTWNACVGVGRFVTDLLGPPAATHTTTIEEEEPCSTG